VTLASGSRLGPYEIVAPLGAGGMGEVYRAKDTRLGREVAVKVLPASFSSDPDRLRRFEQEARAAGVLNHPNVTAVYDIGTVDGSPYVISELLEGETLRSRLAGGALAPRRAIDYALQIAHGLAAAHEKGIVHRDLKPENLFVTKDGRVKILDFGLAKLTKPDETGLQTNLPTEAAETEPGVVMGTLGYMSPEQVRGRAADARSDIFSFGAILYEMLSGRRAFHGDSAADTMSAILREEPAELSATNQQIPPALDRVVRHSLEKSSEQRFQSARDIAYALEEALAGSTTTGVAPPPARARPLRWPVLVPTALATLLAVLIVADVGGLRRRLFGSKPREIQSLAVLPLENLSRDAAQEYLADGMTEALITDLAQIGSLRVISRTSAMRYKGTKKSLPEIARELDVDGVVEGSVLRAGNRIRITAQLIHATTDRHLWARSYERDFKDVLALQDEVAQAIASQIQARLTSDEQARLSRARPVNPEAHEAFLKGRYEWYRWTPENFRKALEYFQQAIAIDPSYAPAYAGLSMAYARLGDGGDRRPGDAYPQAKSAALRAVELDGELAEARTALGMSILWSDWDWAAAERELRRGVDLNPGSTTAHLAYSSFLLNMGRNEESLVEINRAQELDPLSVTIRGAKATRFLSARRYDEAIEEAKSALELDPTAIQPRETLGRAHLQKGMVGPAITEFERAVDLTRRDSGAVRLLGFAYGVAGQREKAQVLLRELEQRFDRSYVSPPFIALVFLGLGDREHVFEWLEKGYELRDSGIVRLEAAREFDPLRSDPRFADLMRRVGLP
jgi:TolB-like protein/Flp pilus assembly protein TadD/predicted Ser/Thr protein kinase